MDTATARTAVADAVGVLGLAGTLDILITLTHDRTEELATSADKLARYRAASDHRVLTQTRERLFS